MKYLFQAKNHVEALEFLIDLKNPEHIVFDELFSKTTDKTVYRFLPGNELVIIGNSKIEFQDGNLVYDISVSTRQKSHSQDFCKTVFNNCKKCNTKSPTTVDEMLAYYTLRAFNKICGVVDDELFAMNFAIASAENKRDNNFDFIKMDLMGV